MELWTMNSISTMCSWNYTLLQYICFYFISIFPFFLLSLFIFFFSLSLYLFFLPLRLFASPSFPSSLPSSFSSVSCQYQYSPSSPFPSTSSIFISKTNHIYGKKCFRDHFYFLFIYLFIFLCCSLIHDQLTSKLKALSSVENNMLSLSNSLSSDICNTSVTTAHKNSVTRRNSILAGTSPTK